MISPRRCVAHWEGDPIRRLVLALDALMGLREAAHCGDIDVAAAVTLAELAGVDAVRLGIDDELRPVAESDVLNARRAARRFELRMTASPGLLKVALEARPDRVLLTASARDGGWAGGPLNFRAGAQSLTPVIHGLQEAGIPVSLRVPPKLDAVKAAHEERATGVELYTAAILDLPEAERKAELESLADAVRLAAKLRMRIAIGGGLGYATVSEVLDGVPATECVAVGRAAISRALLVGMDRAIRDLRAAVQ
jgi:pyridoxine 5-phosphate synthase